MGVGNISSFEARMQNNRAGMRVNSRVPVAVEWAESGRALRAEGYTADVSTKGCLAVIPQGFPVGQRLLLVNLINKNACEAVLIWRGHEGRTGWELGLELQEASMDFWGLDF
ncbi:MAG TPA: PilZ domain-containing protein [Candidatus Binatus sp.]|nr:PilZ domain-containing protein [Candidatus Binatus sp.]